MDADGAGESFQEDFLLRDVVAEKEGCPFSKGST